MKVLVPLEGVGGGKASHEAVVVSADHVGTIVKEALGDGCVDHEVVPVHADTEVGFEAGGELVEVAHCIVLVSAGGACAENEPLAYLLLDSTGYLGDDDCHLCIHILVVAAEAGGLKAGEHAEDQVGLFGYLLLWPAPKSK